METQWAVQGIETIAAALELFGVGVIALAFLHATIRSLLHFRQRRPNAYEHLKIYIGKALQLGLEFLVAADIIRTVTIEPTRERLFLLGLLIVMRTFLSWSITVEIEGCWPWRLAKNRKGQIDGGTLAENR